ncbi:hypothetical protein F4861DRAFT_190523 [Xylaria intraflava]|nr:hypothetical protein F4861DRAFT_190523 [Xylaria intraflava]
MRMSLIGLALALTATAQFPSCDPSCQTCELYCAQSCEAPLSLSMDSCGQCLYCRRESSSCGFAEVESSASPDFCALCEQACQCNIAARCYSNSTTSATPSPSGSPTASPSPSGVRVL